MIIGNAGAGKSTLARTLSEKLKLPLHHLDKIFWLPGWKPIEHDVMTEKVLKIIDEDEWVIDGNYKRTITQRIDRADTIIYLNFRTISCLYGIIKRRIQNKKRTDIAEGCPEKIDMEFLNWVIFYKRRSGKQIRELLKSQPAEKNIIELINRKEVNEFMKIII